MPGEPERLRLLISGRVQGVGYRYWVERSAAELGLKGWVRNLADGRVEAVIEGERIQAQRLLDLAYQGPPFSVVSDIDFEWSPATGEFSGFAVRR